MVVGGQCHVPATLAQEQDLVPILQNAGWAPGLVKLGTENLAPTGIWSLDYSACSKPLYWLHYPSPQGISTYPHINWQKASYIVIFPCRTVRNLPPPNLWIYVTSWSHPSSFVLFSLHSLTSLLVMSLTEENAVNMLSMVDGLLVTNK